MRITTARTNGVGLSNGGVEELTSQVGIIAWLGVGMMSELKCEFVEVFTR